MRVSRAIPVGFVVAVATAAAIGAAQWIVDDNGPADFTSIQSAVNAPYVVSGDTILVRPGIYRGTVYLGSKNLVIRSEKGPFVTILDAEEAGSVISLVDRQPPTRVEGFTIRNGRDQTGGGVWILGGAPLITRNVIEGNAAVGGALGYGYGGGVEIYSSAAVITRNVISGNTAVDGGGGIDVYYSGPSTPGTCCPLIAQNTIVDNVVTASGGTGGGILVFASKPSIPSSIFAGNTAARGGGLFVQWVQGNNDEPSVTSSILFANVPDPADSNGGWRLSSSNRETDPKLGTGEGIALWPRSDSPALDAAESQLPAGRDLYGTASPVDGDVDGTAAPDIGAIESLSEVTGLMAVGHSELPGAATLTWDDSVNPGALFNVYASDDDPFTADGANCLAAFLATTSYTDVAPLPAGQIRFYLVTAQDVVEGSRGLRSDGTQRPAFPSCSSP